MATHFLHLLVRSFATLPSALGSNWLGLLFPFIVFLLTQGVLGFARGKAWMKAHWQENLLWGFAVAGAAWTGLFLWSVVTVTYGDHEDLNKHIAQIRRESKQTASGLIEDKRQQSNTISSLNGKISSLGQECAVKDGINQTLQKQNRDQQSSINGCLNQAITLLRPEPERMTALVLDSDFASTDVRRTRWLLLINRTTTPVNLVTACEGVEIESVDVHVVGTSIMAGGSSRLTQNMWQTNITMPAWGPTSPLIDTIQYHGTENSVCSFNRR
jgi:hypothetical protein